MDKRESGSQLVFTIPFDIPGGGGEGADAEALTQENIIKQRVDLE